MTRSRSITAPSRRRWTSNGSSAISSNYGIASEVTPRPIRQAKPTEETSVDLTRFELGSILGEQLNVNAPGGRTYRCAFPLSDGGDSIEWHSRTTLLRSFPTQLETFEAQRAERQLSPAPVVSLVAPMSLPSDASTEILSDSPMDPPSPADLLPAALNALSVDDLPRAPASHPARSILHRLNGIEPIVERLAVRPAADGKALSELTKLAIKLHIYSNPLKRLPPARRWCKALQTTWIRALKDFAPHMFRVIEAYKANPQSEEAALDLINVYIERCALPTHIIIPASNLRPSTGRVKIVREDDLTTDLSIGPDSAPDTLMKRALVTPFQDGAPGAGGSSLARRTKQATQSLLSNGQAEGSPRTARIMKDMHPEPTREVVQLPPPAVTRSWWTPAQPRRCPNKGRVVPL